jgi:hypothetical protein
MLNNKIKLSFCVILFILGFVLMILFFIYFGIPILLMSLGIFLIGITGLYQTLYSKGELAKTKDEKYRENIAYKMRGTSQIGGPTFKAYLIFILYLAGIVLIFIGFVNFPSMIFPYY